MSLVDYLKKIPVYPSFIAPGWNKSSLPSDLLIIEDDNGYLAWVSKQAKNESVKRYKGK